MSDISLKVLSDRLAKADVYQSMQFQMADILTTANAEEEVIQKMLRLFGHRLGMHLGLYWEVQKDETLKIISVWQSPLVDLSDFVEVSRNTRFSPTKSVPGKVYSSKESAWVTDYGNKDLLRSDAAKNNHLFADIAFPIMMDLEVVGVVELFTMSATEKPDASLLDVLVNIGQRVGSYKKQKNCDKFCIDLVTKYDMVTNSLGEALVLSDNSGRIVEWNAKAKEMFGYEAHEIIGKQATVIMPERFRKPHLERFDRISNMDETVGTTIIGTVKNIYGLHKNGSEFPVETTVGTWNVSGERYFSAVIRKVQ